LREVCRWQNERVPGLGIEIARAVEAAISAAARNPDGIKRSKARCVAQWPLRLLETRGGCAAARLAASVVKYPG
jgi:hypothetical protein